MNSDSIQSVLAITENRSRILGMIVSMVQDFDVAEELFQETVVEILKSEDSFDPTLRFLPWACGIAKHVVQRHWRRQQQSPITSGVNDLLADLATIATEGSDEVWRDERVALRSCFQRLPERMQRLLLLRYGHNIKGQSLAQQLSMRQGSLRTTLARLRSQLRQCVDAKTIQASGETL